jgi:hypothetical protein
MMTQKDYVGIIRELLPKGLDDNMRIRYNDANWYTIDEIVNGCDSDWGTRLGFIKIGDFTHEVAEAAFGLWYGLGWQKPVVAMTTGSNNGSLLRPLSDNLEEFLLRPSRFLNTKSRRDLRKKDDWKQRFPLLVPNFKAENPESEFYKTPLFVRNSSIQQDYLGIHSLLIEAIIHKFPQSPIVHHFQSHSDIMNYERWLKFYDESLPAYVERGYNKLILLEVVRDLFSIHHASQNGYPFKLTMIIDLLRNTVLRRVPASDLQTQALIHLRISNLKKIIHSSMSRMKIKDPAMYMEAIQNGFKFSEYQLSSI